MTLRSWLEYRTIMATQAENREEDEVVRLIGWVANKREHGKKVFITLRDRSGFIQLVGAPPTSLPETLNLMKEAGLESSVAVEGLIKKDPRAPGGVEVHIRNFRVVAEASPWPVTLSALKSPGFLFDMRHLTLRGRRSRAMMLIRAELLRAAQGYFEGNGYVWFQGPTFITSACEGGSTLFNVEYFGRKVYLTQSAQLYEEAAICSLEKVYVIQPSFRSEKSRTRRHLTEYWHIEAEAAFAEHEDIMDVEEALVHHMVSKVAKNRQEELSTLKIKDLEPPLRPFARITYDEALDILRRKGIAMEWGEDLSTEAERALCDEFEQPFFVTAYPTKARSFYHMPDPQRPEITLSSDLIAPGYGEITSGGQRIHDYDLLLSRILDQGLDPEEYRWYLELRRYGLPPHSGFGLGLERVMSWILRLEHIRQAIYFPRTPSRTYP